MNISDSFDSGNIEVVQADDPQTVRLRIREDQDSEHFQWFHFRVSGVRGIDLRLNIDNAGEASYTAGWKAYKACYSYDRHTWRRLETTHYDEGVLTLSHTPAQDTVYYAYFAPYSMERHHDFVARCQLSPCVHHHVLGQTLDGQDLDLLEATALGLGPTAGKKRCWILARQHPGESMAEYFMEGFITRLLDPDDALARTLLQKADFWLVPNMNPDGSRRGHLRTNAVGANLNREWASPSPERSPEVYLVQQAMRASGVDFALDVHGDEALPYNFIAGPDGVSSVSQARRALQDRYQAALARANPDFQCKVGYPRAAPGKANMSMATNWLAEAFGALSMTLEMPFKDNANAPQPEFGWSPARSAKLGASVLYALLCVIDDL